MILRAKHQCNTKIKQIQSRFKSKIEIKTRDPAEKNQKDFFFIEKDENNRKLSKNKYFT